MGLRDLFRRRLAAEPLSDPVLPKRSARVPARWVAPGGSFDIGGRTVTGGMVYVGAGLRSGNGYGDEPALIDPSLAVNWGRPDTAGAALGYWPSYAGLTPQGRAAYLLWLAGGRSAAEAPLGYVFLFFYGLERRFLVDLAQNVGHPDTAAIENEVRRLRSLYGDSHSFQLYSGRFLDLLEGLRSLGEDAPGPAPVVSDRREYGWDVPFGIRVALGHFSASGRPIPADWALAFLRTHPESYLRTAATRCAEEFDELFRQRYRGRFGDGLVVKPPKARVALAYNGASSGLSHVEVTVPNVPDITRLTGPIGKLKELAADCTAALDAYSRYLGRNPDARATPGAVALLPPELFATHAGSSVDGLRAWVDERLDADTHAVVAGDELFRRWDPDLPPKPAKADAVALASLLAKLDVGMEPDVRFGSPTPRPGAPVVLFRAGSGAPTAPSSAYAAAAVVVHLAAAVSIADGSVGDAERRHMAAHIEHVLGLDEHERARLDAHVSWLAACADTGLAGLKRRVEKLTVDERNGIAGFLVGVAAADGHVSPAEITMLTKVYKLLGLDGAAVYRDIHAFDDDGPVLVASADAGARRWRIPDPEPEAGGGLRLDPAKVQARLAETAAVTALLANIFAEEEPDVAPVAAAPPVAAEDAVLGLDAAHEGLARALLERGSWERGDAESLASSFDLPFLDGAVDRINEAAIERCGEPLIDGNDPLEINDYAIQECFV